MYEPKTTHIQMEYSIDQVDALVRILKDCMETCRIITLSGSLGAGKTTLARELLRAHGIKGLISSPTFTYVNCYENDKKERFYHFDLYRVATEREFYDAGFNEYLYQSDSWSIIEWPEIIKELVKKHLCQVEISYHVDSDKRIATITYIQ